MPKTIFLIVGVSGTFEDRASWPAVALKSRQAARRYLRALTRQVDREFAKIADNPLGYRLEFSERITLDPTCRLEFERSTRGDGEPMPDKQYRHNISYYIKSVPLI